MPALSDRATSTIRVFPWLPTVAAWVAIQLLVPLRHFFYPGNVSWTEEGHRFAWHMKLRSKRGVCTYHVTDPVSGRTWEIDPEPTLLPDIENFSEELWGIEDPRITYVPELEQYAVLYTSYSRGGPGVSMALTKDFRSFERLGVVMPPEDKDAALLPRRINGEWALVHRPDACAHVPLVGLVRLVPIDVDADERLAR